ncbi:MAG: TMEM175 family protein [Flavobacteriaceae bacterium]
MTKGRLEAFTDGVLAIIITIMVLEMQVPEGGTFEDLKAVLPVFLSYVLSFIYVAIYWNNHHHMMQTVKHVTGNMLWANMHLLFWLSLIPFVTGWMGENNFTPASVFLYGVVLFGAAITYFILQTAIVNHHGKDSLLPKALGKDLKGKISPFIYAFGFVSAFYNVWISGAAYIIMAFVWLIPDRRIENALKNENNKQKEN